VSARIVIRVQRRSGLAGWWVRIGGLELKLSTQREAIELAVEMARLQEAGGGWAQVMLYGRGGRFRWERTYPDVTRKRRG
jgi:hypothetical protein